jgi:hypothetical protein
MGTKDDLQLLGGKVVVAMRRALESTWRGHKEIKVVEDKPGKYQLCSDRFQN